MARFQPEEEVILISCFGTRTFRARVEFSSIQARCSNDIFYVTPFDTTIPATYAVDGKEFCKRLPRWPYYRIYKIGEIDG